jgi:hypothetical protein
MIRKLASGKYRLYSRKKDPKTGRRRNLGTFASPPPRRSTNAPCNFSSEVDPLSSPRCAGRGRERSERVRGRGHESEPSGDAPSS